jgi:hypothetical protein
MSSLLEPFQTIGLSKHFWSALSLVTANLLPLVGVIFFGWRTFDVVFLFWMENVVIGAINVLMILTCSPALDLLREKTKSVKDDKGETALASLAAAKYFFAIFFTVHYGIFCFVHGVFVSVLLGGDGPFGGMAGGPFQPMLEALSHPGIQLSILALIVSHLVSYFTNFLGHDEYRRLTPTDLMGRPYARIMVLHIAIVFNGFLTIVLGSPIWVLVLLVIGKTLLDLGLHLGEHGKSSS